MRRGVRLLDPLRGSWAHTERRRERLAAPKKGSQKLESLSAQCIFGIAMSSTPRAKPKSKEVEGASPRASKPKADGDKKPKAKKPKGAAPTAPIGLGMPMSK